ncbi:hypothetical protein GW17_00024782 [Ensete ventricosum]|nr:hypothetical protein GW17_00024782 [Ensete ventricosum]
MPRVEACGQRRTAESVGLLLLCVICILGACASAVYCARAGTFLPVKDHHRQLLAPPDLPVAASSKRKPLAPPPSMGHYSVSPFRPLQFPPPPPPTTA